MYTISQFVLEDVEKTILAGINVPSTTGVCLILRYKLGKMTVNEECPELLPAIA